MTINELVPFINKEVVVKCDAPSARVLLSPTHMIGQSSATCVTADLQLPAGGLPELRTTIAYLMTARCTEEQAAKLATMAVGSFKLPPTITEPLVFTTQLANR